jgi:hypothetical protein
VKNWVANTIFTTVTVVYLSGFVVTFGHAARDTGELCYSWGFERRCNSFERVTGGLLAGLFWPLYVSMKVQED